MKTAVHFGAGNIGRGFIGQLLHHSGYQITFIDVNQTLVDDINQAGKYYIQVVGDQPQRILIENVAAINGNDTKAVADCIAKADIVTTAIGPNILKFIAPNIAKGIEARVQCTDRPLNIIACENMVGGSTVLKNFVYQHLPDAVKKTADCQIGFPDAAVDRIVPLQNNDEKLLVQVEEYCEWDVDAHGVVGDKPAIEGLTYVDNLQAYIERKLFTVNTGHAAIAYLAYQKNIPNIFQAMQDAEIVEFARRVWHETGELLVKKYGFDKNVHAAYIQSTEQRFKNPYISDDVTRVARGPIRKLAASDRLTSPAMQLMKQGVVPEALAAVIVAALQFDYADDKEAVELQAYIKNNGMTKAIQHFTEIPQDTELFKFIEQKIAG